MILPHIFICALSSAGLVSMEDGLAIKELLKGGEMVTLALNW